MMKKVIVLVSLFLAGIAAQAAGLPQGLWKVGEVTIEKSTNGNVKTTIYNTPAEVKSYIFCFKEWEIKAESILIRYDEGWIETVPSYTLEGNNLTVLSDIGGTLYQYELNGDSMTLITTYNYVYNHPTGKVDRIEEKWTIHLNP